MTDSARATAELLDKAQAALSELLDQLHQEATAPEPSADRAKARTLLIDAAGTLLRAAQVPRLVVKHPKQPTDKPEPQAAGRVHLPELGAPNGAAVR